MTDSIFGPLVTGTQVLDAVEATVREWQTTYLAEVERLTDRAPQSLPIIRTYSRAVDFSGWPEDQLPSVLLVCPGVEGEPTVHGNGAVDATWSVGVAVIVSASTMTATSELAKLYTAALRTLLLQHPALGGVAEGVSWSAESYDDLPSDDGRTLAAGQIVFGVTVRNIGLTTGGPAEPPDDPYAVPNFAQVETTTVDVSKVDTSETITTPTP